MNKRVARARDTSNFTLELVNITLSDSSLIPLTMIMKVVVVVAIASSKVEENRDAVKTRHRATASHNNSRMPSISHEQN